MLPVGVVGAEGSGRVLIDSEYNIFKIKRQRILCACSHEEGSSCAV